MKWFMIWKICKNIMMVHMNEYSSIYHTIYCLGTKLYIYIYIIPCVPYTIYIYTIVYILFCLSNVEYNLVSQFICNSDCNIYHCIYIYTYVPYVRR